jgi:tRNA nucleotidyltransferase (CCA-adding enzyme)
MDLITSHVNLDFDSLAAMVAAQKLYPRAKIVLPTTMGKNVREFIQLHRDILDTKDIRDIDLSKTKRLIVVDTRLKNRLGDLKVLPDRKSVETIVFDHHPPSGEDMHADHDYSEETGASTTVLIKMLKDRNIGISPFEATLFALGIHEDTGSLTYPSTTFDDADAMAYLMMKHANTKIIHRFLDFSLDAEQQSLLGELLRSAHSVDVEGVLVLFTRAKVTSYVDSASALTHKVGDLENMDVVITFLELKDRINIIGRSRLGEVDMNAVLEAVGGGGHPQAASAVVNATDIDELESTLIEAIKKNIKESQTARDIMTTLVHAVDISTSVKEAREEMRRFGLTGLPITENGKLAGLITSKDVDNAIKNGLAHAPVKGFMIMKVVTVAPDAPASGVQDILSSSDIDRVPVIENGEIIGIISRREILRKIHGPSYRLPLKAPMEASRRFTPIEIKGRLDALLPHKARMLLSRLGEIADETAIHVYLIGGFVRDLLMNHRNLDIDLVVEGSGIEFAKHIVSALGGRCIAHEKFATSVVILPDGFRIDIASARTEFYEQPAALPQVELGSIRQDLFRRDFTVNAMAISLNKQTFGELLDYFGGESDIENRKIHMLHELSFIDDPTRIFRAVRFEQRYGFHISEETADLISSAVNMQLIGRLTGVRIRDELIALLSEPAPWQALKRLDELGVLKSLNGKLQVGPETEKLLRDISLAIERFRGRIRHPFRRWLVFLIGLTEVLTARENEGFLTKLKMRKEDARIVVTALKQASGVIKRLGDEGLRKSRIHKILREAYDEALIYYYARGNKAERFNIDGYFEIRDVRLKMTGNDLIRMGRMPSVEFSKVLDKVLAAKLDGKVSGKEDEIEYAKRLLARKRGSEEARK